MYVYLRIPDAGCRCWHADLRDKGVSPRYLVSLSSLLVAVAPFTATRIREPFLAVIYGMNVGGVWGVKGTMAGTRTSVSATATVYLSNP